jgi:hypothetical protein
MARELRRPLRRLLTAAAVAGAAVAVGAVLGSAQPGNAAGNAPPTEKSPPTISGTPQEDQTLTAATGTWDGATPITYSYQWRRCNTNGGKCGDIDGQTSSTYQLTSADVKHTIRVTVTAKNADGSASDTSAPTAVVKSAAASPTEASPPTIGGTPQDGKVLTASAGKWNGTGPISFSWQWRRCDAQGGNCGDIGGANDRLYPVTSRDVGHTLRVQVTAKNSAGSASDTSAPTAVVTEPPPPPAPTGCPGGSGGVNVSQLSPPARLTVDGMQASPSTLGRNPGDVVVRFHVSACGGRPVSGALVYVTAVPYAQFTIPPEAATGSDGWVTETMHQDAHYPASPRQQLLAVFVRARKPGENVLGGISTRRLVSFPVDLRR